MNPSDPALAAFEEFLTRWHEGCPEVSLETLCGAHPSHAAQFRRWWKQLVRTGEVTEHPTSTATTSLAGPNLLEGGMFGAYRLQRELGRGAQGTVFLAEDSRLRRNVALKILPLHRAHGRDFARRFAREAELASRLDDPGIITIFERGEVDGAVFLAMRHVEGETLAAKIARAERGREGAAGNGRICIQLPEGGDDGSGLDEGAAIRRVLALFERIAGALHAAHEQNLIHRDVKPGNVLVDTTGQPVVVDFGLARDIEEPAVTLTGDLVGTPAYLSPEQIAAMRIGLDRRTDIWSLAVTMHECLTLRRPFEGATRDQLYQQILTADPPALRRLNPHVPRDLATVLATALQKDRNRRYQTARDFAEDLRRVRCHEPIRARPPGPLRRLGHWARRSPALAAATALAFSGLALGLGLSLAYGAEARRARITFARLADQTLLDQATASAAGLYPARPERLAGFQVWLGRFAEPLRSRLPEHAAALAALRLRADAWDPPAPADQELAELRATIETCELGLESQQARRAPLLRPLLALRSELARQSIAEIEQQRGGPGAPRFADDDTQVAHDQLAALVEALGEFLGPDGLAARVRRDAEHAARLPAATLDAPAAAWRDAAARVAAHPRYAKQELRPQLGLVPLGPDPQSRLEEFARFGSGEIPSRDPDGGGLLLDERSALVLVLVPGGEFEFLDDEPGGSPPPDRRPLHLDWFLFGKTELSHGHWRRLGGGPAPASELMRASACTTDSHPVDGVGWFEAREFLLRFDLDVPTEAQWEHAARGGRDTRHWWGDGAPARSGPRIGNLRDASYMAAMQSLRPGGLQYDDGFALTAPVGTFSGGHPFGLCDVYGNVAEWCRESFVQAALWMFPARNGDGFHQVLDSEQRSIRGGWWFTRVSTIALAQRDGVIARNGPMGVGIRPVRRVE